MLIFDELLRSLASILAFDFGKLLVLYIYHQFRGDCALHCWAGMFILSVFERLIYLVTVQDFLPRALHGVDAIWALPLAPWVKAKELKNIAAASQLQSVVDATFPTT